MTEESLSGVSQDEQTLIDGMQTDSSQAAEPIESSYTPDFEDERELKSVRERLDQLHRRINKLDPPNAHLEGLKENFTWSTGGNRRGRGTQFRREANNG